MTLLVVDASVVIEYLIQGPYTDSVRDFFAHVAADDRLLIPEFGLLECTNVIWKQIRFNQMPVDNAQTLVGHLRRMPLQRVPLKSSLDTALTLAIRHTLSVYDSAYITIAQRADAPLVSLDQSQRRAATAEGVLLAPVGDL